MMERVYRAGVGEPLRWIALAVFDPSRFRTTYEPGDFRQRASMLARLIVPLFLFCWLFVLLVQAIPLPAQLLIWSGEAPHLPLDQWKVAAIGVIFGLVIGLIF